MDDSNAATTVSKGFADTTLSRSTAIVRVAACARPWPKPAASAAAPAAVIRSAARRSGSKEDIADMVRSIATGYNICICRLYVIVKKRGGV